MTKKAIVALSIFAVLFVVAWWANEINEKRYYIDDQNEQFQGLMIDGNKERFRPREYIKIKR